MGGDKCNQSSSRQGRRALPPRGRGLLVLSSPGIIKQGNWKWYLIDTAISTGAARAPSPRCRRHRRRHSLACQAVSRLRQVKRGEGMNEFPLRPGRHRSPGERPVNLEAQRCEETREGGKFYVGGLERKIDFKMSPHQRGAPSSSEVEHAQPCVSCCMYNAGASFCSPCTGSDKEPRVFWAPV